MASTIERMPLPSDPKQPWPPSSWEPLQRDVAELDAWYSGDPAKLMTFYGTAAASSPTPDESTFGRVGAALGAVVGGFWSGRAADPNNNRVKLHAPVSRDVAQTAADYLFGEDAAFTITEAKDGGGADRATAAQTQERLDELAEEGGFAAVLLEGAEVASALGGVYLRPVWDSTVAPDRPFLDVVHPDCAVPEFRFGVLTAVTFWRVLDTRDDSAVWRHLERRERGAILHGLYVGDASSLGARVALAAHPDTAHLAPAVANPTMLASDVLARYVPNVRPNPKRRGKPVGRADCAGVLPELEAIDETWTSLLRDVRLCKARIMVPDEFLDRRGLGAGATFDMDREIFSGLSVNPTAAGVGITTFQAAIRVEEHTAVIRSLFEQVARSAGYSPQSFGAEGDGATQTATEVDAREGMSERTTRRKQRYWRKPVEDVLFQLLVIDADTFGSGVEPLRPRLVFAELSGDDMRTRASTLNLLALAESASTETKVRYLNPEWSDDEVAAEVALIKAEKGAGGPNPFTDPTGGAPDPTPPQTDKPGDQPFEATGVPS